MAEPKKKLSKTRTRSRRHQIKIANPGLIYCDKCREPKLRHAVCPSCGSYKGVTIVGDTQSPEAETKVKE